MERFKMHLGLNYSPEYICSLSDDELIQLIEESPEWDIDLLRDLVWRASDDLCEEWEKWEEEGDSSDRTPDYFFSAAKELLAAE